MAAAPFSGEPLWRFVTTASSRVECVLEPLSGGWWELRLSYDDDVLVRERFDSFDRATAYGVHLQTKIARLAARRVTPLKAQIAD